MPQSKKPEILRHSSAYFGNRYECATLERGDPRMLGPPGSSPALPMRLMNAFGDPSDRTIAKIIHDKVSILA